uniref:Uncharacterized protein n=1 Tax=Dulem virus 231 TaxID=3145708 RepID=A0AAU8AWP6_9VIRU
MAHSFYKRYLRKYRKVVISHVASTDGNYHRKTFKDCTVVEAMNVFNAMAKSWQWFFIGFDTVEY